MPILTSESELVSGFMTEHAAVIFVFFFLAEYASIVLICILTSILFLGGYLFNFVYVAYFFKEVGLYLHLCLAYLHLCFAYLDMLFTSFEDKVLYPFIENNFPRFYDLTVNTNYDFLPNIYRDDLYMEDTTMIAAYNYETLLSNPLIEGLIYGLTLGFKSCVMIFIFIWVRASFPRIRYDQLMSFCWTILLPLVIAFIILLPCLLYSFDIISTNVYLL